eukprot:Partr_v1_DN24676_c0_g1_i1_m59736 putative protein kinase domain containing protein
MEITSFPLDDRIRGGLFSNEMLIMRDIGRHPNIIYFKRTIDLPYGKYALMPLMQGSLTDLMQSGGKPLETIKEIAKQLVAALYKIHHLHIIHCDLKPANILVESISPLHIRLGDFGLAYQESGLSLNRRNWGSPSHMPLEKVYNLRSGNYMSDDIWALGITLSELVSSRENEKKKLGEILSKKVGEEVFDQLELEKKKAVIRQLSQYTKGVGTMPGDVDRILQQKLRETVGLEDFNAYYNVLTSTHRFYDDMALRSDNDKLKNDFVDFLKQCLDFNSNTRAIVDNLRRHPFLK